MGTEQALAAAPSVSSSAPGSGAGLSLAGLIDVLDRADATPLRRRPPARRGVARASGTGVADRWDPMRTAGSGHGTHPRPRAARGVPLRPVLPAPAARIPAVRPAVPTGPATTAVPMSAAVQAGARRTADAVAAPQPPLPTEEGAPATTGTRRRSRWRALVRRLALWGAGPDGAHLAWGAPPPPRVYGPHPAHRTAPTPVAAPARRAAPRPGADAPVVLREMPSTPTIRPAAPSPAAALLPAPAMRGGRDATTAAPSGRTPWARPAAGSAARSSGPASGRVPAAVAVGLSARAPVPARARAPAGPPAARGSPASPPVRGSPPATG